MDASVIIPTHNRSASLARTLESLSAQIISPNRFEIIVVDDGSDDGTALVAQQHRPQQTRYAFQSNQGDAAARNLGARLSKSNVLVFLDDDIVPDPDYLAAIVHEFDYSARVIRVGLMRNWPEDGGSRFHQIKASNDKRVDAGEIQFAELCSNNFCIGRDAYMEIGRMKSLGLPGSDIWCDVDFAYRAHNLGYKIVRVPEAICYHLDHTLRDISVYSNRMYLVGSRAVPLFHRYPDLIDFLPMFEDKTPIVWGVDRGRLILWKIARRITSSGMAMRLLSGTTRIIERRDGLESLLRTLYRWIGGGSIYRGYREGLKRNTDRSMELRRG